MRYSTFTSLDLLYHSVFKFAKTVLIYFRIMENGSLYIEHSSASHEGHYLCKADNGVAHGSTLSKLAEIKVNGKLLSL